MSKDRISPWERFLAARKASVGLQRLKGTQMDDLAGHLRDYRRFWGDSLDRLGAYLQQLKRK